MSLYTTGELAKKCGVSVRTVQYYDERGILVPTELTEGGRRLFSEDDIKTLETICFLRDLDISIKDIAEILESKEGKKVIELLLDEQEHQIQMDIEKKSEQLEKIRSIKSSLTAFPDVNEESIHDISTIMAEKKQLRTMYKRMAIVSIPLEIAEIATFIIGIIKGVWLPFAVTMGLLLVCAWFMVSYWYKRISYICPECHTEFKPKKKEAFLAFHTAKTRKLTCPCCSRKIWCLELYREEVDS